MSDALPARQPLGVDALSALAALPAHAREHALAEFLASRAGELAREARRVVRTYRVAPADRAAAHDAVTTAQQALMRDVATGRRSVDARSWAPTVRAESARAVRRSAAQGAYAVVPYRQRLAAQRATLLAVRETAAEGVPPAADPRPAAVALASAGVPSAVPPTSSLVGGTAAAHVVKVPVEHVTRRPTGPAGTPRHARRQARAVLGNGLSPRKSLRWSAAALLSTVTIVVGAAVAPAEERPDDGTGASNVTFVDRLTMPIVGLWDNLVGNGKDNGKGTVVPVPVESPTPSPPAVQPTPAPTATQVPVAPAVPAVPAAPAAPVPGGGPGRSQAPQDGGRHGNSGGWRDHDDLGRGEWHERDDEDDDRDDDERRGDRHGRDDQRGQGRGDRDGDRGAGHRDDRSRGRGRNVGERRHGRSSSVPRV
ncbi:hypothetical protein [Oerskovia paurometabola]|uniref:hypothetical protein n=1 Tax=Oerskovia paurometabola TaxID=162170 RepID=UPI00381A2C35